MQSHSCAEQGRDTEKFQRRLGRKRGSAVNGSNSGGSRRSPSAAKAGREVEGQASARSSAHSRRPRGSLCGACEHFLLLVTTRNQRCRCERNTRFVVCFRVFSSSPCPSIKTKQSQSRGHVEQCRTLYFSMPAGLGCGYTDLLDALRDHVEGGGRGRLQGLKP